MKILGCCGILLFLVGCHERVMVAPSPHAVVLAIKAQCDADDAVRAADNPQRAYLWRLDSWHEEDDWIRFYIAKYDDIFTRTRMEIHALPAADEGKVVVDYTFKVTESSPVAMYAVGVFSLDRPTPKDILDKIQELVAKQPVQAALEPAKGP